VDLTREVTPSPLPTAYADKSAEGVVDHMVNEGVNDAEEKPSSLRYCMLVGVGCGLHTLLLQLLGVRAMGLNAEAKSQFKSSTY